MEGFKLPQLVWKLGHLRWKHCKTLNTAPTLPQIKPHTVPLGVLTHIYKENRECSQCLYEVLILSVGVLFIINKPFDFEASVEILLDLYKWIGETLSM